MLAKLREAKAKQSGFTIIEVMIVLAVAGLIMVIVLVAIPQLQRNQRNAARRDVLGRIKAEIDIYSGNNNANIPTASGGGAATDFSGTNGFTTRYLTNVDTKDPSSGNPYSYDYSTGTLPSEMGVINYRVNSKCNGETPVTGNGNRTYSVVVMLEGGAFYCLDNSD